MSSAKIERLNQGSRQDTKENKKRSQRGVSKTSNSSTDANAGSAIPLEIHQAILQVFQRAFPSLLNPNTISTDLRPRLQQIKHHLYNRDFAAAFGDPLHLSAYAVRWSASRALGYLEIFRGTLERLPSDRVHSPGPIKVTALGGGAGAEAVALAAVHRLRSSGKIQNPDYEKVTASGVDMTAVDLADWSSVISPLQEQFTVTPLASLEGERLIRKEKCSVSVCQQDLLSPLLGDATESAIRNADLVTIMFTLNELFTTSLKKTQLLLLRLTSWMKRNALLLVVDSPGSYSVVKLGSQRNDKKSDVNTVEEKTYPMAWLLEHAVLTKAGEVSESEPWEKIQSHDSKWFRLPNEGLSYPLELENMRYQLHLFMKT